jgi:hypothetical protein
MNDWYVEKMAESQRQAVRREFDQIHLEEVTAARRQPWLFRLGSGLVALGERIRKRNAARERDYWALENELKIQHR